MIFRNRELRFLAGALIILTAVLAVAATYLSGGAASLWVIVTACVLGAVFAAFTRARYRRIQALAGQLDNCLHGERALDLDGSREGELAVLGNEIDKLLQRLTLAAEQLEAERGLLADALADISHQLKTPMTSLSIMTELIRKRISAHHDDLSAQDIAAIAERIRAMEALEERMTWLVSTLLKLARVDAGTITLSHMPVSAQDVIADAAAPLAVAFDLADVALETEAQEAATFLGDAAWTAEALRNVLKNCLEHTPAGGVVRVRATEDALACRISVTDTGPGIADEDLPHIFERFYRGQADRTAQSDVNPAGVGIGLALARSLIAAQEGTIRAKNVRDGAGRVTGAQFEIAFFKATV